MGDRELLIEIHAMLKELTQLIPNEIALTDLARELGKDPSTIRKHLLSGAYEPDVQFYQTTENGKIYIRRDAAAAIRRHYA